MLTHCKNLSFVVLLHMASDCCQVIIINVLIYLCYIKICSYCPAANSFTDLI